MAIGMVWGSMVWGSMVWFSDDGSASFTVTASGSLKAVGALVGSSAFAVTTTGTLQGSEELSGSTSLSITCTGTLTGGQDATDTHDGYWAKRWLKLRKKAKEQEVVALIEELQELEEPTVKKINEAIAQAYSDIDYRMVANNLQLQRFITEQLALTQQLMAQRKQQEILRIEQENEDDDIEVLLMA